MEIGENHYFHLLDWFRNKINIVTKLCCCITDYTFNILCRRLKWCRKLTNNVSLHKYCYTYISIIIRIIYSYIISAISGISYHIYHVYVYDKIIMYTPNIYINYDGIYW